ncbi:hypothetical protein CHARACLAT_018865 [Characodon lateralis]|uniref:Uncharacterized protein n=1 Tax=Characodon lateralis TaxID=208331 RepID=A0ABU7CPJ8_9TELE|nr:hypothetical protein [Characodon lateralis]
MQGFSIKICNSECEEPQTCPHGPRTDTEEIRATDIKRPPKAQEPLPGLPQPPQRRAGESHRGTTQQPQGRGPTELQQRSHKPHRQPSTWTQRPETPGHITPQEEARQSPGVRAPASSHRE